jgi:DNA polymerase zeta
MLRNLRPRNFVFEMSECFFRYGADHTSELHIAGRIVLNVWRLMRSEVAFYSYTFENMMFHVLHERLPKFDFSSLTAWWKDARLRSRVIDYYLIRVNGNLNLLEQLDLIGRTSELARIFGIQVCENHKVIHFAV